MRDRDDAAGTANPPAAGESLDRGPRGAAARRSQRVEAEREIGRIGQLRCKRRSQAIGRHDVEADAGTQHDARAAGIGILRVGGLEYVDLAGDVEVVRACREAGRDHRRRGRGERARAMQHRTAIRQRVGQRRRIIQAQRAPGQPEFAGQRSDRRGIAAGQRRAQPAPQGLAGDQFARVAVGTVDQAAAHSVSGSSRYSTRLFCAATVFQSPALVVSPSSG